MLTLCYHTMNSFKGRRDEPSLGGGERSALRSGRFASRKRFPSTRWLGGWVGPRHGLCTGVAKRKILSCRDPILLFHSIVIRLFALLGIFKGTVRTSIQNTTLSGISVASALKLPHTQCRNC